MENKKTSAFVMALMANVLWATSFMASKYTLMSWGPYTAVLLRLLLSIAVLLVSYRLFGVRAKAPHNARQWLAVTVVGVILGALYPLQLGGLLYISTGFSAAIMLLAPLFLVVLAPLLVSERLELQKMLAIFLGIAGGIILLSENMTVSSGMSVGVGLTLAAALCLAIFTLMNRKFSSDISHPTMTLYSFVVGAIVLVPFSFFESPNSNWLQSETFINSVTALIYLAVACTAIPFFIWNKATAMTEAKNLASTMHVKTPVAIILGAVVLNEPLSANLIIGTLIVSVALWLSQTQRFFKNKKYGFSQAKPYFNFRPDLIVEATNACNRACPGCYAPNVLVTGKRFSASAKFLSPVALRSALSNVDTVPMISIRGGEPSIHPEIHEILQIVADQCETSVLETHGRWITSASPLLEACKKLGVHIKVSFDSMHGLSLPEMQKICDVLNQKSVNYLVAITESSEAEFEKIRALCHWVPNERIIYQKKAKYADELIKPRLGVVAADGDLAQLLSVKERFVKQVEYA